MQGYATAGQLALGTRVDSPRTKPMAAPALGCVDPALIEGLLGQLADLVVDRLLERTETDGTLAQDEWLDTRAAAEYLGVHRDTLRKLAAERSVPAHQDAPGCKLYFRRDELDKWRRSARTRSASTPSLTAVS